MDNIGMRTGRKHYYGSLLPGVLMAFFIIAFSVFIYGKMLQRHLNFFTTGDHAIFEQMLWAFLNGSWFYSSIGHVTEANFFLSDHQMWILPLLAPVYAIWQDPMMLYVIQIGAIATSAVCIYYLASFKLETAWAGLAMGLSFLGFFVMQQAIMFDFRPIVLSIPLWLATFIFFEKKEFGKFVLFALLTLGSKEEVALTGLSAALYFAFRQEKKYALFMFIASVGFLVINLLFIPGIVDGPGSGHTHLSKFRSYGSGFWEVSVAMILDLPRILSLFWSDTGLYIMDRFAWHSVYLICISPASVISIPYLAYTLMSDESMLKSLYNHYPAAVIGPFYYAFIVGLGNVKRLRLWLGRRGFLNRTGGIIFMALLYLMIVRNAYQGTVKRGMLSGTYYFGIEQIKFEKSDKWRAALDKIPDGAPTLCEESLCSYLARRDILFPLNTRERYDVDYVVFSERQSQLKKLQDKSRSNGFLSLHSADGIFIFYRKR